MSALDALLEKKIGEGGELNHAVAMYFLHDKPNNLQIAERAADELAKLRANTERLAYQDRWLSNGIYFRTQEYIDHCNEEDNKLNIAKAKLRVYESEMLCGHKGRYAVFSADETTFCLMCAYLKVAK